MFIVIAIAAIAIWQFCDFFLSRRDYYVNSPYAIIKKKVQICIKLIIYLGVLVAFLLKILIAK